MAQPTLTGMTLNAGAGGLDLLYDLVGSKVAQVTLQAFSTGDGALNVVMADAPLPVTDAAVLAKLTTIDADTGKIIACNTGAVVLASGTVTTVSAVTAITNALPAGDNNIGNVDIVTLPAANLGQKAMAASLSVVPASDITDATYIGDIRFGEALVAGTALIGKVGIDQTTPGTTNAVAPISGQAGVAGGTGAMGATVQRVTLATDDPAVVDLAAIEVLLDVVDDWDESDRAKVNPIAGQAGIAANAGAMDALTTRVTIATDDTHYGTVGAASDIDGVVHGQLRYIADQLVTIDSDTNNIKTAVELLDDAVVTLGTTTYTETTSKGLAVATVRNDDLAPLADTDNGEAPLQTNAEGALYTTQASSELKSASGVAVGGAPGTDDMIAAVGSRYIKVVALTLTATSTTTNSVFIDNVDNDLWHNAANPLPLSLDADADTVPGIVLPYNPAGWFKTDAVNEAVTLNSSAAQDIAWSISWEEVL